MKKQQFDKISCILLTCGSCILPLFVLPLPRDGFYMPKAVMLYVIAAALAVSFAVYLKGKSAADASRTHAMRIRPASGRLADTLSVGGALPAALAAFFTGWLFIASLLSVDPALSFSGSVWRFEGWFTLLCYAALYLAAANAPRVPKLSVQLFFVSMTLAAAVGIFQHFGIDLFRFDAARIEQWRGWSYSVSGNPNFFGALMVLAFPVSAWLYLSRGGIIKLLPSCITFFALLCSETQGAWIGAFASFALMAVLVFAKRGKYEKRRFAVLSASLAALAVLYQTVFGTLVPEISGVFIDAASIAGFFGGSVPYAEAAAAGSHRAYIWQLSLELIAQRPVFGFGPECMQKAIDLFLNISFRQDLAAILDRAHNEYLHYAVSGGIPAAAAYISMIWTALRRSLRRAASSDLYAALAASVTGYAIAAVFNISVVSAAPVFFIFMGLASRKTE